MDSSNRREREKLRRAEAKAARAKERQEKKAEIKALMKPVRLMKKGDLNPLDGKMPYVASILHEYYLESCGQAGRQAFVFAVDMTPPSVNNMYVGNGPSKRLSPLAIQLRQMVKEELAERGETWSPGTTGTAAVILLLETPEWVTQKLEIRERDADNKIKPILDAVQEATGNPDETTWNVHAFKCHSAHKRTWVMFYDLGDIVESWS